MTDSAITSSAFQPAKTMVKKIVFINSPSNFRSTYLPHSLLWLATFLNTQPGIEASILDMQDLFPSGSNQEDFVRAALESLRETSPDYIGLPCYTPDYHSIIDFARLLKDTISSKIIIGNVHASLFPEDFIFENSPVDFVVIGEGEISLSELIQTVGAEGDLSKVDGIAYFDDDSGFVKTPRRNLIHDLDDLPIPDYSLLNMEPYLKTTFTLIRRLPIKGLGIYAGRGCPYKCIFCAANTLWRTNTGKPIRFRKPETIVNEISFLQNQYGIEGFYFMDDTFTFKKELVLDFCDRVKNLELIWGSCARVNEIDEEMVKKMKAAGCVQLDFGIESGSPSILKKVKKGINIEQIETAFEICRKYNMRTFANMMVNLPGETEEDILMSEKLLKRIKPTRIAVAVATPLPATELHDKYLKVKIKPEDYPRLRVRNDQDERFKFSLHNIPSSETYDRVNRIVKPLIPDYIRIFTNKGYLNTLAKSNKRFKYLRLSLLTWLDNLYQSSLIRRAFTKIHKILVQQ